jgi:CRP-like cAMP-binding protein
MLLVMQLTPSNRSSRSKLDLLRKVPAFAGCNQKELAEAARHVDEWSATAGTSLTREGAVGHEAFVIIDGQADVMINGESVAELGPGQFVGEMAMLDRRPRSATVVAQTDMRLLLIGPAAFDEFASLRAVARALTKELADRLRRADARVGLDDSARSR